MSEALIIPNKALFRPGEVAKLIGVSPRTMYRYMEGGEFGELHIFKRKKITRQGLLNFLDRHMESWESAPE